MLCINSAHPLVGHACDQPSAESWHQPFVGECNRNSAMLYAPVLVPVQMVAVPVQPASQNAARHATGPPGTFLGKAPYGSKSRQHVPMQRQTQNFPVNSGEEHLNGYADPRRMGSLSRSQLPRTRRATKKVANDKFTNPTLLKTLGQGEAAELPPAVKPKVAADCDDESKRRAIQWTDRLRNNDPVDHERVFNELCGSVKSLSCDKHGCRVIQTALQVCTKDVQQSILAELKGHVRTCIADPHANHVIQRAISVLTADTVSFIVEELRGVGANASKHRYGCRVMLRLIEHFPTKPEMVTLIEEVVGEAEDLVCHQFGHHVLECVLERGSPEQRHRIAIAIFPNVAKAAQNQHVVRVIEKAFESHEFCCLADQERIVDSLLNWPQGIAKLAESQSGTWVVQALLKLETPFGETVTLCKDRLRKARAQLEESKWGSKVLQSIGD